MTVQEFYQNTGSDYISMKSRISSDTVIAKFLKKFTTDPNYQNLYKAIQVNDRKAAFEAAHSLKGVADKFSFTTLQTKTAELVEELRPLDKDPDVILFADVTKAYQIIIKNLEMLAVR